MNGIAGWSIEQEDNLKLTVDHLGMSCGQHDYEMRVTDGAMSVAVLSFCEFEGVPHVNWIQVEDGFTKRGIAGDMIRNLQARYPDTPIDFGYTTPDGTALLEGLEFRTLVNPVFETAEIAAVACRKRIAEIEAAYDRIPHLDGAEKDLLLASLKDWNEILDELEDAERILADEPKRLRFVVTREPEINTSIRVM
ncbi:hypothetical protein G6L37_04580 [Agrobacterium rubi]|nr:hypothetical protein [Agrobacterium rubi]NTF24629.1 hypothetical protein [Agrobacterium rubi]